MLMMMTTIHCAGSTMPTIASNAFGNGSHTGHASRHLKRPSTHSMGASNDHHK